MAAVYQGMNLTYTELNEKSNQLARCIRKNFKNIRGYELTTDSLIPCIYG